MKVRMGEKSLDRQPIPCIMDCKQIVVNLLSPNLPNSLGPGICGGAIQGSFSVILIMDENPAVHHRYALQNLSDVMGLRISGTQEFPASRHIEEELFHPDAGPGWTPPGGHIHQAAAFQ